MVGGFYALKYGAQFEEDELQVITQAATRRDLLNATRTQTI